MTNEGEPDILLFSYGTLQQEAVQRRQFGRLLAGEKDAVPGYQVISQEIKDPDVVALSGLRFHPNLVETGDLGDEVTGTAYHVTKADLAAADAYEVSDYRRVRVALKSGRTAWLYVKA